MGQKIAAINDVSDYQLCSGCGVCAYLEHSKGWDQEPGLISELRDGWGPVYGLWEGYAADPDVRRGGPGLFGFLEVPFLVSDVEYAH